MGQRLGDATRIDEATAVFAQTGAKVYLAFSLYAQAVLATQTEAEAASVLQCYDRAISALDEVGAEYDLGVACTERARLREKLGEFDYALNDLAQAQRCFKAVGAASEQDNAKATAIALSHERTRA
jgi:tetratricopeptide (TPR) repeat protein